MHETEEINFGKNTRKVFIEKNPRGPKEKTSGPARRPKGHVARLDTLVMPCRIFWASGPLLVTSFGIALYIQEKPIIPEARSYTRTRALSPPQPSSSPL
jgi:hypothetical protein